VIVNVTIDTSQPLSTKDLDLLHMLTGLDRPVLEGKVVDGAGLVDAGSDVEPAAPAAPAKKAAAKKAAPAKKPAPAPEPEDEPDADLRATALQKASTLLAAKKRDVVLAALEAVEAERVGDVAEDRLQDFIDALDA
jgi:hypothetical protein